MRNFKHINRITLWLFLAMVICFVLVNFYFPKTVRQNFVDGDGSGHYAYLPAIFVYHTVDFTAVYEFEKQRRALDYQGHYFHKVGEVMINKFSSGTALLQLPFFLLAWLASVIFGLPLDGYNVLFQYSVAFSAFFYVFLGLVFVVKLSKLYGVRKEISIYVIISGLFATNLFFYTFLAPSMSHAYSFALIAIFLFYMKKSFLSYSRKFIFISAFILGLIVLVRPVNLIVLAAMPFLAGSPSALISSVKRKIFRMDIVPAALLFLLAVSPQLIINFLQTGNFIVLGYRNEGFYFNNPEIVNFLFSYRKGWLVYTPFMLLLIPSLVFLYKRSKYEFITFLLFIGLLIYVFSSWWNWLYGDSFGMRPMVDFYALFILIIALFTDKIDKEWQELALVLFVFVTISLNLFQTSQYSKGILHPDSMTKDAYWYVFLKGSPKYEGVIGDYDEYFYGKISEEPFFETEADFTNSKQGWNLPKKIPELKRLNKPIIELDENMIYSPSFKVKVPDSLIGKQNIYIKFLSDFLEVDENAGLSCLFVADISDDDGNLIFYKTFQLKRVPDDQTIAWRSGGIGFKLPKITSEMDQLTLYIWNKNKQQIYLDSIKVGFYTYGP